MRRAGLLLASWLVLLWTNPALNEDGTTCDDLSYIRVHVTHKESGQSHDIYWYLWRMPSEPGDFHDERPPFGEADTLWRSHPGLPDSVMHFALPPASSPYDWWRITIFAGDFAGNESDSSNTISVTAPLPGEVE